MTYPSNSDNVAGDQIRAFVERIERLHEERQSIATDIKEVYAEAKGNGFDVPALKAVIKIRGQDRSERMEREALIDLYMSALGMQGNWSDEADEPRAPARAREIIEEFPADEAMTNDEEINLNAPDGNADEVMTTPPVEISPAAANALKLRPHCLHANDLNKCGGHGKVHCFACQSAHAEATGHAA